MIEDAVIARLLGGTQCPFALVEGVASLAALVDQPAQTPAAFVFIKDEAAGENERATGVLQRVETDVAVVIVTANAGDAAGGRASGDLAALKGYVHGLLLGWEPDGADDVVTYVGGEVVRARGGCVWFEAVYATAVYLEA